MNSLKHLLSPFDVAQFFTEHWHRKPLYIRGEEGKFANLPGINELPALLSGKFLNDRWIGGQIYKAQASFVDRTGNTKKLNAVQSMWPDLFNAGASLCFEALHRSDAELTRYVDDIASTTPLPGKIVTTCYLTPPNSGSGMHFDSQHAFFMQVAGKKHWKFSQRAGWKDAPANLELLALTPDMKKFLESTNVAIATPMETGLHEVTLNTGDVLYLPPGFWHEARTSDSPSLHHTLTFVPLGAWQLLVAYLRRSAIEKPSLRRDLRYASESGDGDAKKLLEIAIADLQETVNHLSADEVERFFHQVTSMEGPLKDHLLVP
jgi:ribosomal protein L16 Arg81 hydroxylase